MFKSKLERFIAKRVLIFMILLSILDILILKNRWLMLVGFILGTILSIAKLSGNAWAFSRIFCADKNGALQKLVPGAIAISQLVVLMLLLLTYFWNHWIFSGFVAGILLVPFIMMINSVTEAFGFTKNHFE